MTSPSDLFRLDGKTIVVTGATRGIGAGIAKASAEAGAKVWIGGRDIEKATQIAGSIPNAQPLELNVTDATSVKAAFMSVRKADGQIDTLVNNAGIMHPAMIATSTEADLDAMMDVNIKGSFLCAQLAARIMAGKRKGSIINIASIMGTDGASGYSSYAATKAAVLGMTASLAKELAPHQIRVNALAPGFVDTDLTADLSEEMRAKALEGIGMKRFGTVDDIAATAVFLSSDASSYITGQTLGIDGSMRI